MFGYISIWKGGGWKAMNKKKKTKMWNKGMVDIIYLYK